MSSISQAFRSRMARVLVTIFNPRLGGSRCAITTRTGAFLPKPKKNKFALLKVLLTVLPGLYLGATISKEGAAFLEENDIFVPDEDDDED